MTAETILDIRLDVGDIVEFQAEAVTPDGFVEHRWYPLETHRLGRTKAAFCQPGRGRTDYVFDRKDIEVRMRVGRFDLVGVFSAGNGIENQKK